MAKARDTYRRGLEPGIGANRKPKQLGLGRALALGAAKEIDDVPISNTNRMVGAQAGDGTKQVPLYVMVAPEQLERFKARARQAGMSLREYVTNAVEAFSAQMTAKGDELATLLEAGEATDEHLRSMVSSQAVRLSTLEKRVDQLQRWLERNVPDWDQPGPPKPPVPLDEAEDLLAAAAADFERLMAPSDRKKR